MKSPRQWWKTFFDPAFYSPASPDKAAQASAEARFIRRALGLRRGASLLDLCCGPGRHSLPLARGGLRVTGFDYSLPYLLEARARARRLRLDARFVQGDMRRLPFEGEFDAAICMFTSFGYFERRSEDLRVLRGVRRALRPGGLFLLDVVDRAWLARNASPRDWHFLDDGGFLLEERRFEDGCRKATNRWIRVFPDGESMERVFSLRQYDALELRAMLRAAGLRPGKVWGDFDGSPPSARTRRLIALSRRPS